MTLRIAINGFGRIGRLVLRMAAKDPDMEVVAINDLADAPTLAHLLVYDSIYGKFDLPVKVVEGGFEVDGKLVKVMSSKSPEGNVWGDLGVDLVYESTGIFTSGEKAKVHLDAGAKWVMITAPGKNVDATIVYGVNHKILDPQKHKIFSNASCTTNCLAPVVKVIHDRFGIEKGLLNTIHSVTNDQRILDLVHKDLRRARAATMSMIPTTTGAAKALGLVLPELKGKLDGFSLRVPTMTVSCCDFTFITKDPISAESLNIAFREAAAGDLKGILDVCDLPLVSIDFSGSTASSTVDALSTMVMGDRFGKVLAWYDNEFGYATRCIDVGKLLKK